MMKASAQDKTFKIPIFRSRFFLDLAGIDASLFENEHKNSFETHPVTSVCFRLLSTYLAFRAFWNP